jgi:hypothetical protein
MNPVDPVTEKVDPLASRGVPVINPVVERESPLGIEALVKEMTWRSDNVVAVN